MPIDALSILFSGPHPICGSVFALFLGECILKINFTQRCNFRANKFMCSTIDFPVQQRQEPGPGTGEIKGVKLGAGQPQTVRHFIKYEIRFASSRNQ